ncbi:sugar kinase, ribokinase family [Longilinea arvoryzae]|uniref:Ribokinase n=2 Tax=Longilinea arvoryzae TaxID=360412 RepID=A0A0S7B943_9CHLR|nr:sugar kinase, ribokinase family [Longilinea arvoryzae]
MTRAPEIVVLGHHGCGARQVRVHHIPVIGETVIATGFKIAKDGGKGSHQAMVIGRLGGNVGFIGKIATDEQSDAAKQWLIDDHVDITHLLRMDYQLAGAGMIMVDDNGNNAIVSVPGIRATLKFEEVKPCIEDFKGGKYFITGFEIPIPTALEGARLAKSLGMQTILNPAPAQESIGVLDYIDILIPNETEAKILAGHSVQDEVEPAELAKILREKYQVKTVIITLGEKGALCDEGKDSFGVGSVTVKAVDTTGAGDTFIGAFTLALAEGKKIQDAMAWANYAAALSVSRPGSIPSFPRRDEMEEFIKRCGNIEDLRYHE